MSVSHAWLLLLIAGLLEIGWAIGLKFTEGFTRPVPTIVTLGAIVLSMYLWSRAVQVIPMGTAYAVWVGIGALGAAVAGILFFREPWSWSRLFFIALLIASIAGLKWTTPAA